jgi:tRNA(fMet)-specific endonuclease VapC
MKWLLDTNACIRYLNGRSPELRAKVSAAGDAAIVVCSVVKAELFFGAVRSTDPAKTLAKQQHFLSRFISLPFDDAAASAYGTIRGHLTNIGQVIGPNDLLIAAIAVANGLKLVSRNLAEFSRVPGLTVEDWEAKP